MKKVLIANRGEIACRIAKTCRQMGLATVAVHSEADAGALHVEMADEAVEIGPPPAPKSYLDVAAILDAARRTGAEAVHPGYGFLSENTAFAEAVMAAGLRWVGPDPATIRDMGDKDGARRLAQAAGVPVLPASDAVDGGDVDAVAVRAREIGYPLLVKAAGGGGGIGMRRVDAPEGLAAALSATAQQAERAFGNGKVFLERFVRRARHVEVQVFGTGDGRAAALAHRDCSVQRRFQKVIEEAPAPGIDPAHEEAMYRSSVALAEAERYAGAGTVEFIVDADTGDFYFLEMNTRLQVEHGVTELVLGIDLVERQLCLAGGDTGDDLLASPSPKGHAIEVRIYAENPEKKFLPQPGTLARVHWPDDLPGIRVDTGVRSGDKVTPYYDPMLAKVMAHADDRGRAIDRLIAALGDSRVEGLACNLGFLINALDHREFRAGQVCTDFIDTHIDELIGTPALAG